MGWWSTNREGHSLAADKDLDMVWGDGPADILGAAIDQIDEEFNEEWGRPATTDELIAGMRFSYRTIHAGLRAGEERPGSEKGE